MHLFISLLQPVRALSTPETKQVFYIFLLLLWLSRFVDQFNQLCVRHSRRRKKKENKLWPIKCTFTHLFGAHLKSTLPLLTMLSSYKLPNINIMILAFHIHFIFGSLTIPFGAHCIGYASHARECMDSGHGGHEMGFYCFTSALIKF